MDTSDQNYQEEAKYAILTQKILGNKNLTPCDKLVMARITGFERFYESSETTGEFLGISADTVKKSKQRLLKEGLIVEIGNTGRGKIYAPNLHKIPIRRGKSTRQTMRIYPADGENLPTENKERLKREYKGDESVARQADEEKKTEYGREDINELVELWEAEIGITIKGQQNQRRQLYNLLRKYGSEATKALVKRVGVAIRSGDRFAPQIATPSDLTGKYSKLPKLELWESRRDHSRPFGQGSAPQDDRPLPSYLQGGIPDYNGAFEVKSDEERAKVSQMFKEARKTLPFMQKKGGQK